MPLLHVPAREEKGRNVGKSAMGERGGQVVVRLEELRSEGVPGVCVGEAKKGDSGYRVQMS